MAPTAPYGSVTPELGGDFSLDQHLEDIQRDLLRKAMTEAKGVKTRAARLLGIKNYQTLDAQLRRLKVDWSKAP
jgi:transcriptional regulator with GAF, ATPase, and Fis domain